MPRTLTLAGIAAANMHACLSPGPAFLLIGRAAAGPSPAIGFMASAESEILRRKP